MNLKKVGIVISHEYSTRVRKKSFILITILTPLLMGLLIAVPFLIMFLGGDEAHKVKIVDESGIAAPYFDNEGSTQYVFAQSGESVESLKGQLEEQGLYAVVGISGLDEDGNVSVISYSNEPLSAEIKSEVTRNVNKAVEDRKLAQYNITNLDEILEDVKTSVKFNSMTLTSDGGEKEDSVELYMILAYVMSFFIYIFVFMFGTMVMRSVIDEKSSRVVEVVVSSIKSMELMVGKIIGVALVAITQFGIWVLMTLLIVIGASSVASNKMVEKAGGMEAVMAQLGTTQELNMSGPDIAAILEATSAEGENTEAISIIRQVTEINWGYILVCFLIYFILGYLLYAAMFAAIGAAVDNEADTGQLQLPVTIPLMLGLFIMLHAFEHPSSQLSFWASIIPWTSPMVMLARIPFGVVPAWQLILSVGLLLLTFLGTAWLSAKIYKVGILTFGKKSTFKDLVKWMKQKN